MLFPPVSPGLDRWTLAEAYGRGALTLECEKCWRLAALDVPKLMDRHGPDTLIRDLLGRSVCMKCGTRRARPILKLHGVRGDKSWWPHHPRAGR